MALLILSHAGVIFLFFLCVRKQLSYQYLFHYFRDEIGLLVASCMSVEIPEFNMCVQIEMGLWIDVSRGWGNSGSWMVASGGCVSPEYLIQGLRLDVGTMQDGWQSSRQARRQPSRGLRKQRVPKQGHRFCLQAYLHVVVSEAGL